MEYKETSGMFRTWLGLALLPSMGYAVFYISNSINNGIAPVNFVLPMLLLILFLAFFSSVKLSWSIKSDGFTYRFFPFNLKVRHFDIHDITHVEVLEISPIREFGGWGLRFGKLGKAFTTHGNHILHLELRDGSKLNFTTDHPNELQAFLSALQNSRSLA
jgi:hypothetical protein